MTASDVLTRKATPKGAMRTLLRTTLFASVSMWPVLLCAQEPLLAKEPTAAPAAETRLSASITLDSNHGSDGTWMQLTPEFGYQIAPRWSVDGGVPVYYLSGGATYSGVSVGGIGDVYSSLSFDMSRKNTSAYTAVTLSAPTGNVDNNLGAGRVSWDWTTHVSGTFGRFSPYATGGAANNLKTANESLRLGAGTARAGTDVSIGKLAHAEAGVEVGVHKSVSLTGSAYGVFNLHSQTGSTAATTLVEDDITDHGVGLVLWGQATPSLDLSIWVSHSLAYIGYTTVTLSATYTFGVHPTSKPSRTHGHL